jgi:protein gp37
MRICALKHATWFPRVQVSPTLSVGRDAMDLPLKWNEPRHVFVMPGHELFERPDTFIVELFGVMARALRHEFQISTRRPDRALELASSLTWGPNVWLGALLDDHDDGGALETLRRVPAQVRFAHLLTTPEHDLPLDHVDFVIAETAEESPQLGRLAAACDGAGVRLFSGARVEDAELRAGPAAVETSGRISMRRRG